MVGPARFERATLCLEGRCSIQLSYGPMLSFYQRREKCQRQIIAVPSREAEVYTFRIDLLRAAEFSQNNPYLSLRF
jgi:hypothetical protein